MAAVTCALGKVLAFRDVCRIRVNGSEIITRAGRDASALGFGGQGRTYARRSGDKRERNEA
ncbi:MAG TPA: hypothetical protein VMQ50_06995 [Casimicrobiaceae bacterium]|nr:hypothetical protein [Casimicrobiaceae bacterium]